MKSQNFHDFEFIIIDGGSKDKSLEVIKENETLINYWVSEKDSGIYNAMNKGINKASGKYILFLNSGDYLLSKDALSIDFKTITQDIVYGHLNLNLEVKILNPYTLEINSSCMSNNVKSLGKFGTSWSVERVGVICRAFGIKFKMQGNGGGWVKGSLEVDTTLYPKLDRVRRANMIAEAKIMEIHNNSEEFVQDRIGRKLENDGEYQL